MSDFFRECENTLSELSSNGFVCYKKEANEDYELIQWRKGVYILELYLEKYEYALSLSLFFNGNRIDSNKLFKLYELPFKTRYEYSCSTEMYKAVAYYANIMKFFLKEFDTVSFKAKIRKCIINAETDLSYFLNIADNFYLTGMFVDAKRWYERYEVYLNELQRKRLERIRKMK